MRIEYAWDIIPTETPIIEKKCGRCDNNQFICSEKFRINSNKKMSDVWLIYKCTHCHSTWNMDILTRVNLSRIDPSLFSLFQENNVDLAWQYAFDKSIHQMNKVRANGNVEIDIIDSAKNIFHSNEKQATISIHSKYPLAIPIRKILKQKLGLSTNQLDQAYRSGAFVINHDKNNDLSKKVGFGCILEVNVEMIKNPQNALSQQKENPLPNSNKNFCKSLIILFSKTDSLPVKSSGTSKNSRT
jgi:hypothetical protein